MTTESQDRLSALYTDPANASKQSRLVADIKNPQIREILSDLIEAKVSDSACKLAICRLIDLNPEAAKILVNGLALTNSSSLRQNLSKGFSLPTASTGVPTASFGL